MDTINLNSSSHCQACDATMTAAASQPFCTNCGWESFLFFHLPDSSGQATDAAQQLKIRQEYLAKSASNVHETTALETETQKLSDELEQLSTACIAMEKAIQDLEHDLSEVENEIAQAASFPIIELINPNDPLFVNVFTVQGQVEAWRSQEHFRIEGCIRNKKLHLFATDRLPHPFDIAVGFSRKPKLLIEDAEYVWRVTIKPQEQKLNNVEWESHYPLPLELEGEWFVKMTPFKQNKIADEDVSVHFAQRFQPILI